MANNFLDKAKSWLSTKKKPEADVLERILPECFSKVKSSLFILFLLTGSIQAFPSGNRSINFSNYGGYDIAVQKNHKSSPLQIVYICTGPYSYAYHSSSNCAGLGNCSAEIRYTDENTASNSLGRVPCCRCWSNVAGRCKDDNPYSGGGYGGGDNSQSKSDAMAYLAIGMVAASAVILSNDFYVYPTVSLYSLKNDSNIKYAGAEFSPGFGWCFGFRKTFPNCALEYGASYIKQSQRNQNAMYSGNYYVYQFERWGGHLNFVHNIFYSKTPDWLKIYTGPTLNYIYDFGFGGIIGAEIKLLDRLRFDARYELTNQTNQFQVGLIINYQKKYFWQK